MPHVKLPPATRNWKEIPSPGSYRVVVAPPRLQHTAVWLGRRSAHAWESPTARPYPKRSLGSAPAVEAFAAAPTSSAPEQSAAPEARTVHARKPPRRGTARRSHWRAPPAPRYPAGPNIGRPRTRWSRRRTRPPWIRCREARRPWIHHGRGAPAMDLAALHRI